MSNKYEMLAMTACFVTAGLTGISGAATTYSTSATTLQYAIGGVCKTKAQVSGGTTPTTDVDTAAAITLTANQARVVVFMLDTDGTVFLQAGSVVSMDASGNLLTAAPFPSIDLDTYCPIAHVLMKGGSTLSGTFTVGSSNWNTTGMSYTVTNISTLPNRPVTA